jgi:hypothetical protein
MDSLETSSPGSKGIFATADETNNQKDAEKPAKSTDSKFCQTSYVKISPSRCNTNPRNRSKAPESSSHSLEVYLNTLERHEKIMLGLPYETSKL